MSNFSVSSVSSTSGAGTGAAPTTNPLSGMGGDDFMLLLLTQLRNQNPLDPMQDKDMMAQMTQLNSLQELQKINAGLQALGNSNGLTEAAGLIGKTVEVQGDRDGTLKGVVTGVSMIKGQVMLLVGDKTVPLSALLSVSSTVEAELPE